MHSLIEAANGHRYGVIYVDPPWRFKTWSERGMGRSPSYRTMILPGLIALPVDEIAADNCVLAMWHISTHVRDAMYLAEAWGFRKFIPDGFIWVKTTREGLPRMGLGYHTRRSAELCALAFRGNPRRQDRGVPQVLMAPRGEHSTKPAEIRNRLRRLYSGPYFEMFARQRVPGWAAWGDEI